MAINSIPYENGLFNKDKPFYSTTVENVPYDIYYFQGSFCLYSKGFSLGQLISGQRTLDKKFKGSFENWIQFIREKDNDKILNALALIEDIKKDIKIIESVHHFESH